MKRQGLLYHYSWPKKGELKVGLTRAAKFAKHAARTIGAGLVVAGVAGLFFTFQPVISSELRYRLGSSLGKPEAQKQIARDRFGLVKAQEERTLARKLAREYKIENTAFSIYVPKISARATILENVDPAKQEEYLAALKKGVAHAAGTSFPGSQGGTYLFAHSTDAPWNVTSYNAVFYLLRELEEGDEIYVFFLDKVYKYRLSTKQVVEAKDVSWLTQAREGPERLILQTCWPPGTTWKRLILTAEPEKL